MSPILKKFDSIFWRNKACRNLFLLNKDELLEHQEIILDNIKRTIYDNVIVVTNERERENNFELITSRVQNRNVETEFSLENKLKIYKPKVEKFVEDNFKKSIEKLEKDCNNPIKGLKLLFKVCKIFNKEKGEKALIELLQEYYFIGKNISSIEQLEIYTMSLIKKNFGFIVNEETTFHFYDSIENIKHLYTNVIYKRLLNSKRVITKYLDDKDNFEERVKMLDVLYEAGILESTNREAFFECTNCDHNLFKGTMYLKIRPKKLSNFKCPNCDKEVFYLAPYKLNAELYKLVVKNDGVIIYLLEEILKEKGMSPELNIPINFSGLNSEIDVATRVKGKYNLVIESKMLFANNSYEKHIKKILTAVDEVVHLKDILQRKGEIDEEAMFYLVINIDDRELIESARNQIQILKPNSGVKLESIVSFKEIVF